MKSATKKKGVPKSMMPKVGECVFIRTVTHYYTGRLLGVCDGFLVLGEAAWIADTGRFADYLQTGIQNEVEPYPVDVLVRISIGAIVDMCDWKHALPSVQK